MRRAPAPAAPERDSRGAWLLLAMVAALCIATSVTFPIYDPDLWQHLAAGRHVWETRQLPNTQIWTWPTYGAPDVMHSWAFRVLLYPFWSVGGVTGLFVWRWLATLAAFAVLWAVARRMGAGGVLGLVMLVLAALVWRQRTMARPETLVAILLALELWILESRRSRTGAKGADAIAVGDHSLWLVPLLWVWVQAHVSFVFGFAVLAIYALGDLVMRRVGAKTAPGDSWRVWLGSNGRARLLALIAAAAAVAFVNPYGAGLVLQPFDFFLHHRNEPLLRSIDELRPVNWSENLRNGLPLFVLGWPLLALARAVRGKLDPVELLLCALFTAAGLASQRFMGFQVLVAAPFIARDLAAWQKTRPGAALGWMRAAAAAAACVALCIPEWTRPEPRPGFGVDLRAFPVVASDFIEAHGVRGRSFNYFYHGGWLLWRSHGARDQLPFMDVHQAGTPEIRAAYHAAFFNRGAWRSLNDTHHFDWLLLRRTQALGDSALDFADDDTSFARVFLDDAAALYVRRDGVNRAVAESFGYRVLPGGTAKLAALGRACESNPLLRAETRAELERARVSSPHHARAASLLANVAMIEARFADARVLLLEAQAIAPGTRLATERLAMIAARDSSPESGGTKP